MSISKKIIISLLLLLSIYFANATAQASPVLRIEVGQHTAMINRLSIDKAGKLLATASDDKTVRLWNLPDGSLYTTLRVPIGENNKGALYAVALAPDGKTLIASGETGDAVQKFSLYVFDVEKRSLKARIPNLPSSIYHLAYSEDGKVFAAAFSGGYGIRVWDSQSGKLLAQDTDYAQRSTGLAFNQAGNLAAVSYDGYIRLYDPQFKLLKKAKLETEGQPSSVSFSANGLFLAVGYANLPRATIADLNLNALKTLDSGNTAGDDTAIVAWQTGSNENVFVAGSLHQPNGQYLVRHWQAYNSANPSYRDIEVGKNIVTDLTALPSTNDADLSVIFATAEPAWGAIKADVPLFKNQARLWDARFSAQKFNLSDNGLKFAYAQSEDATQTAVFDASALSLQTQADEASQAALLPAVQEEAAVHISDWRNGIPVFNGKRLSLEANEKAYALAIAPNGGNVLIGTNYYLRRYDRSGKELSKVTTSAEVYGLNISANAKLALAALGDGTIRWYSLTAGEELSELAALFPYDGGKDWIIWTKEGFFGSSDGGGYRLAGYLLDKGEGKHPDWIEFSQLYQSYYAPELIAPKLLGQNDKLIERLKSLENIEERFNKKSVPIIELTEYCVHFKTQTVAETQTQADGWLQQFKQNLRVQYAALKQRFGFASAPLPAQTQASTASQVPVCYPIVGQGQSTRAFVRKELSQSTVFRSQLTADTESIDLRYLVKPKDGGLGDIDIYVNGQILYSHKQALSAVAGAQPTDLKLEQHIDLREGENEIKIQAYENSGGTSGLSSTIALFKPANESVPSLGGRALKPKMLVLAVGIDRYAPPNELKYAVKDSSDFLKSVSAKKSQAYSAVVVEQLFNENATLANIEAAFDKIAANLAEDDAVLIYLSGHGFKDVQDFYFIPYGVDDNHLSTTALSQNSLKRNIAKLSKTNKVFIFIDSCHSGSVDVDNVQAEISSFDKIKHQLGENIFVLAAAGANQESQDQFTVNNVKPDNGLFAYAVLEGLNGKAKRADDNVVDSFNLGSYVQRRIDTLTEHQTLYKQKARFQRMGGSDIASFDIAQPE